MEILKLIGNIKTSDFPTRITDLITTVDNLTALNSRLDRGGVLILENATLFIGEANPTHDSYFSLGVAKLKLVNSKIYTLGNTFEIFCKELEVDNTSLLSSFPILNASNGINGNSSTLNGTSGNDGDNGGVVRITLTENFVGSLNVKLDGQSGGNGGDGYIGLNGKPGAKGRGGQNGDFGTCRRGPGNGGDGTNGQNGGNAGNGGNGGNGGKLIINYVEKDPQSNIINFSSKAGKGGKKGNAGTGGKGGKGGPRGAHAGNCISRGRDGRDGNDGHDGLAGTDGLTGQDGNTIVQRVNINQLELKTIDSDFAIPSQLTEEVNPPEMPSVDYIIEQQ